MLVDFLCYAEFLDIYKVVPRTAANPVRHPLQYSTVVFLCIAAVRVSVLKRCVRVDQTSVEDERTFNQG